MDETYNPNDAVILNYLQDPVEYKNIPKVWLTHPSSTEENVVRIPFTYGEVLENVQITPDFSEGDMVVSVPDGYLVREATVVQPAELVPENIAEGVVVAGIEGTFKGGSGDAPQLFKPSSLSYTSAASLTTRTARLSVNEGINVNGSFPRQVQLVSPDGTTVYATSAEVTAYSNHFFYGYNFIRKPVVMPFTVSARIVGAKFAPSDMISNTTQLFLVDILKQLTNCSLSQDYPRIFSGDDLALGIVPSSGFYYPKSILIEPSSGEIVYTYNPLTGKFVVSSIPQIDSVTITAVAPNTPWLQNPEIDLDATSLTVKFIDPKATSTVVSSNGVELLSIQDKRTGYVSSSVELKAAGASYGFTEQADGYYKDSSSGSTYTASMCKVHISMKTAGTVTFSIVNYGYSSYDYGIVSKVDQELSTSYSSDIDTSSSKVYTTYRSSNSTTAKTLSMSVPAGDHFICFKYRRYLQSSASYEFKFKVTSVPASYTKYELAPYIPEYGIYPLDIQSIATGYTPSDTLSYTYTYVPTISVSQSIIYVNNLTSDVTQVDIVVDDVTLDSITHDGSGTVSLDISGYNLTVEKHVAYARVHTPSGIYQSNILDDAPVFTWNTFADADWEYINAVSQLGFASQIFNVGDTKNITYNTSYTIKIAIADFDVDDLYDGTGKAGISWIGLNTTPTTMAAYSSSRAAYLNIQDYLTGTVWNMLPSNLTAVLKTVNKQYDAATSSSSVNLKTLAQKLWSPSITEIDVSTGYAVAALGTKYKLFNDKTLVIRTPGATSGYATFWTRSAYKTGYNAPMYAYINGTTVSTSFSGSASTYYYVLFGGCI